MAWLKQIPLDDVRRFLRNEYLNELERVQQKIREVERRLKAFVADDALVAKLLLIVGIGPITAITMRAEIARFERFDSGKQLSRYCGVSPRNASSGHRQADAGLVKAGNPHLRRVIIQAAQRLINYDRRWGAFAARKFRQGKPRNVVVAAVANRWIRKLYHLMQPEQLAHATGTTGSCNRNNRRPRNTSRPTRFELKRTREFLEERRHYTTARKETPGPPWPGC